MKLFLSSYRLGNNPQALADMFGTNKRIAVISNALDNFSDVERRKASVQREMDALAGLGLQPEELDLREYYVDNEKLNERLSQIGGVWVMGGNTFVLRKVYEKSGFDKWLIGQKENDEFVYAGYSAGICVLAPSIEGLKLVDDPEASKILFNEDVIWEGLGILDYLPVPHYKSNHPESDAIDEVVEYLKKNNVNYRTLSDGDVITLTL